MAHVYFKTSERQRASSQVTRQRRAAVGKAQPAVVDEALSAAVKSVLRDLQKIGDRTVLASAVLESIFTTALDHLASTRDLDRVQSQTALKSRLTKRRHYTALRPKTL